MGEGAAVDLGVLLACLSRQDLELALVQLIARHPQEAERLYEAAHRDVDTEDVHNEVFASMMADSALAMLPKLQPVIARANNFCKVGAARNGMVVLQSVTPPLVTLLAEEDEAEAQQELKGSTELAQLLATLEEAWREVLTLRCSGADELSVGQAQELFAQLGDWRTQLTPLLGPLFSDPLRVLKKHIQAASKASQESKQSGTAEVAEGSTALDKQPKQKTAKNSSRPIKRQKT
eukprot:g55396.t1